MDGTETVSASRGRDAGFALIMAILALLLLTFLGLTMAFTTSTEQLISANYRMSRQAHYNAEGCLQAGASLLVRATDWATDVLPPARTGVTWTLPNPAPSAQPLPTPKHSNPDRWGNPSRNFESANCDEKGGHQGYGVVLDDPAAAPEAPYQYTSTLLGIGGGGTGLEDNRGINGTCTLWVRRVTQAHEVKPNPADSNTWFFDGTFEDAGPTATGDQLVLTAEGTAPSQGGLRTAFTRSRDAIQVVEMTITQGTKSSSACSGTRGGQAGQGPEGANFGCAPVTAAAVSGALGLGSVQGTSAK